MVESFRPGFPIDESGVSIPTTEQPKYKDLINLPGNHRKLIAERIAKLDIPLSESELKFFEFPNRHNGSDAVYLLEQFVDEDWLLASHLEPKRNTSRHKHIAPMGTEQYYWLAGEAILNIDGEDVPLDSEHDFRVVPLDAVHQLRTEGAFVLTLIVMKNARLVTPENRHIRV
ncbi:MAG: hypothetical protein HYT07_01215 [Candidatus Levybacteria bacterium]|nr:hypothetical protein [Candidatus Levybacteria bacterium]